MASALPVRLLREAARDVAVARERDPAARGAGRLEVLLTWPGVQAVLAHRIAHRLHRAGLPLLPRLVAHVARAATGVEIHPGARIGHGVFIDHGAGVVIGETAEVGDDVTLFQGATLGGLGADPGRRHPCVGDGALIGAGARLLGPLRIGAGARVGANAVVLQDVPSGATFVGNPGRVVRVPGGEPVPADPVAGPDPLLAELREQRARLEVLERRLRERDDGREAAASADGGHLASVPPLRDVADG